MPTRIAVLGSTRGSDLPAVVESIKNGELKGLAEIAVVISDNKNAGILEKAKEFGLYPRCIPRLDKDRKKVDRDVYYREISGVLTDHSIGLLVNIGWMQLNPEWFVKDWYGRNMNIHPSLLPSFTGMDLEVHKEVLAYGCKVSGCTLFFIDQSTDTGPIILQEAVSVSESDTPDSLKARVQQAEQRVLPRGIRLYAENRLRIERVSKRDVVRINYDGFDYNRGEGGK